MTNQQKLENLLASSEIHAELRIIVATKKGDEPPELVVMLKGCNDCIEFAMTQVLDTDEKIKGIVARSIQRIVKKKQTGKQYFPPINHN